MRGIDFLKAIGHVEDSMVSEAANPVKQRGRWNGSIVKFAGLAACIAVFVGAIFAGQAGLQKKNHQGDEKWMRFEAVESAQPDNSQETQPEQISETGQNAEVKSTVYISIEEGTLTADGADFLITNTGAGYAISGEEYRLECLKNGVWTECDHNEEEMVFIEIAWQIDREWKFSLDWSNIYGTLEEGHYRLVKTVYTEEGTFSVSCEFDL